MLIEIRKIWNRNALETECRLTNIDDSYRIKLKEMTASAARTQAHSSTEQPHGSRQRRRWTPSSTETCPNSSALGHAKYAELHLLNFGNLSTLKGGDSCRSIHYNVEARTCRIGHVLARSDRSGLIASRKSSNFDRSSIYLEAAC